MDGILQALGKGNGVAKPRLTRAIPPCTFGRQLAISDIHGCHRTFDALLNKLQLDRNDQLFLLGDFISRGPDSGAVLDTILDLQANGYQVFSLRGNHEQLVLDCLQNRPFAIEGLLQRLTAHGLLNKHGQLKSAYETLLNELYWYFELEEHFLVHAGFNFNARKPFKDHHQMLSIRGFGYDKKAAKGKTIVHGHTRTTFKAIRKKVASNARVICIDNGCCNTRNVLGHGRLVGFDLTNNMLIPQKNLDLAKSAQLIQTA